MSTSISTILVAEEHDATRAFLADNLTADGYRVLIAADRAKALALLTTAHPDLVLVDINGQTLGLLDAIRSGDGLGGRVDPDVPLIVLSRDADRLHRIRVLERGGDDIVRKPFAYPELRARVGAVLRRSDLRRSTRTLRAGPIAINVRSREVHVGERPVELSAKEYDLLVMLAGEPTRVFTRAELIRGVWGVRTFGQSRTLDSHACRLRRKLCGDSDEKLVINVWGVGYRLIDPAVGQTDLTACRGAMSDREATPRSVACLYQQLAAERAGAARAALARERTVERLFSSSAAALEDAAGALLHAAATFIALEGPLPGLFAEQAGALLAVAARFEEAADLTRTRESN